MKKNIIIAGVLFALFSLIYTGVWFYSAHQIQKRVNQFYFVSSTSFDFKFSGGELAKVGGFPFLPHIRYTGGIVFKNGIRVHTRSLIIKPSLFSASNVRVRFPKGVWLKGAPSNKEIFFKKASFDLVFNERFPRNFNALSVKRWYDKAGSVQIKQAYFMTYFFEKIEAYFNGRFSVDINLQPFVEIQTTIRQPEYFLEYLFMDTGIPNVLKQSYVEFEKHISTDEKSDAPYINIETSYRNNRVYFGSVPVWSLSPVVLPR